MNKQDAVGGGNGLLKTSDKIKEVLKQKDDMIGQLFGVIRELEQDLDEAYKEIEQRSPLAANAPG